MEKYSPEKAYEEASQMQDKIKKGEAKNYNEAERLIESEKIYEKKRRLISVFPEEMQEELEKKSFEEIKKRFEKRKELGYEKVVGYHVSNIDFPIGSYLSPGKMGEIYYSDNPKNLYGRYGGGYIYVIEGTGNDKIIDTNFGWRTTKGKVKIIDKIKITPESMKELGAEFADCEYH